MTVELAYSQIKDCSKAKSKTATSLGSTKKKSASQKKLITKANSRNKKLEELVSFLKNAGAFEVIFKALASKPRIAILSELLSYEAKNYDRPLAFTELKERLERLPKSKFAYHLDQLQKAGLVRQLTQFASDNQGTREGGYHSYYRISEIAVSLLNACTQR